LRQPRIFFKAAISPFKASGDGIPADRFANNFPFSDYHAFSARVKGWNLIICLSLNFLNFR
jgi:hypothetical protein